MILKKIDECYRMMDGSACMLIRIGLYIINIIYFFGFIATVFYKTIFPDFDTTMCFLIDLLNCAKEFSGAVFVPVLLYQLLVLVIDRDRLN